ncbi:MAG: hypothetical protein M3Y87_10370 [Myxococcota bacterium]|nr:hypothetical protein [Myxococcota bacterium]
MGTALLSLTLGLVAALVKYWLRTQRLRDARDAEYGTIEYVPKKRRSSGDGDDLPRAKKKRKTKPASRRTSAPAADAVAAPSPFDESVVERHLVAPHADPALPDGFGSALALPIVPTLYGAHAIDASHALVVGARGYLARVGPDGAAPIASGVRATLRAVHAEGDTAIAVGDGGTVLRIRGNEVSPIEAWSTARFDAVHVASSADVIVAGERVLRGDDRMLHEVPLPSGWKHAALARRGASPGWLADGEGQLALQEGDRLAPRGQLPSIDPVVAIAIDARGGVASIRCDAGEGSITLERDGEAVITSVDDPTAIAAHPADDSIVVATQHGEVHWIEDGKRVATQHVVPGEWVRLEAISIAEDGTVWTAGERGLIARGRRGSLEPVREVDARSWRHLAVSGREVWIAADRHVARWDGERFFTAYGGPRDEGIQGICVSASGEVFLACASNGHGSMRRWRAGRWSTDELGSTMLGLASQGETVVATSGSSLLTWTGRAWSERALPEPARKPAIGADGTVWALGSRSVIRVRDARVETLDPGLGATLYGLWPDGNGVWVAASDGAIARFDGTKWTRIASPTTATLFTIGGLEGGPIYAGGYDGTLVRIERERASESALGTDATIFDIRGSREAGLWLVGPGLVARAAPPIE